MTKICVLGSAAEFHLTNRLSMLSALQRSGYDVIVCAPDLAGPSVNKLRELGFTYHGIPFKRTGLNPIEDLSFLRNLTRWFKTVKPDILICYHIKPVIYGCFAARISKIKRVFPMITGLGHAFGEESKRQILINLAARFLYRLSLRNSETIFFENTDDRQLFIDLKLIRHDQKTFITQGSGVDLKKFSQSRCPTDPLTFIMVARLLREKGCFEYAEAARRLKRKYPNTRFWLLGRYESVRLAVTPSDVERWGKEGGVDYLGTSTDVPSVLARSSVFVLPTFYREGLPLSLLEAMAIGRALITTDTPGCRQTVRPGINGFFVPAKDSAALANTMEEFIKNPSLAVTMGQQSHLLATRHFDVRIINSAILSVVSQS